MPLAAGRILSFYEILGPIGTGGMGEVYRARDTRLERDVAVKVLPAELSDDEERLRRFEREAKALASLNHPNVAQVYGIDQVDDVCFIAMELVPGSDLAQRLARGRLPADEALDVCRQIAEGLEAAHEAGIVHRDLKPGNVVVTPEGVVKLLDFGLAKPVSPPTGPGDGAADSLAVTVEGTLLGTPMYMSPEQARGRPVDRRADVWAFGCVLFECLTGRKAFDGGTSADLVGAIVAGEPDWGALERRAPPRVATLVRRALQKDPRRRLRDVGDARLELEEVLAEGGAEPRAGRTVPRPAAAAALALALVLGGLAGFLLRATGAGAGERPPEPPTRLSIDLPEGLVLDSPTGLAPPISVSADGRSVVFAAVDPTGERRLYLRRLGDPRTMPIPGTEGAEVPFFSRDGARVGFATHRAGKLQCVDLSEMTVEPIEVEEPGAIRGASWGPDGMLVLGVFDSGLLQVWPDGRPGKWLTTPEEDEVDHRWPQILHGGESVLFTAVTRGRRLFRPRVVSLETGEVERIDLQGAWARCLPGGFLVYIRSHDLWARRFDLAERRLVGEPKPILQDVHSSFLGPHLSLSEDGSVLVYEPLRPPTPGRGLVWVDRDGNREPLAVEEGTAAAGLGFEFPRLSPARSQILVAIHSATGNHDVWAIDANRGTMRRITSGGNYLQPCWTPRGDGLVFTSVADRELYRQEETAGSTPVPLLRREGIQFSLSWAPNGRLLFYETTADRGLDLLELLENGEVRPLVSGKANECAGTVSPDGTRLAYVSDETGSPGVYVRSYPDLGTPEAVSEGTEPVWSSRGDELFYRYEGKMYAVSVPSDGSISAPRELFEGSFVAGFTDRPNYDYDAENGRFLMVEQGVPLTHGRLEVILGFQSLLERELDGDV